jgi:hypothetical protein
MEAIPIEDRVCFSSLKNWDNEIEVLPEETKPIPSAPFSIDRDVNKKLFLWCGDITLLDTDAIVNSTNETMSFGDAEEKSFDLSYRIIKWDQII